MSAYIVNDDTIDMLASAASLYNVTINLDADGARVLNGRTATAKIAAMLHAENVKSVNHKYGDTTPANGYEFTRVVAEAFTAVEVLRAASGLRYQSCEHPDYWTSDAAEILNVIERAAIRKLPGFDDAPREWTREQGEKNLAALRAAYANGGGR
jgi:hypothetical protein